MGILLDKSFLYALYDKKDKYYKDANRKFESQILEIKGPSITPSLVVNETYTLAMYRSNKNNILLEDLNSLFFGEDNFFEIKYFINNDFKEIYKILMKYSSIEKLFSFADASLIYLYKTLNYKNLISFDHQFDGILERIY